MNLNRIANVDTSSLTNLFTVNRATHNNTASFRPIFSDVRLSGLLLYSDTSIYDVTLTLMAVKKNDFASNKAQSSD